MERPAFAFLVLGAALSMAIAVANVCLGLSLAALVAWRVRAARAGEDPLAPFRRGSAVQAPIAAFVAWTLLAIPFSTLPARSIGEVKGQLTFLLVPAAAALLRGGADLRLLGALWRLAALYLSLRGLFEFLRSGGGLEARLTAGLSVHMTYAGLLMLLVLVLLARAVSPEEPGRSRLLDGGVAALGTLAIALSLTRNAYLGLAAGVLVLVLLRKPKIAFVLVPLGLAAYLAAPAAVRDRARSTFDPADETVRDRVAMWRAGRLMIRDHPLFGVGPGRIKEVYPDYRQPGFVEPRVGHLHNNLVMTAAETGLPSAAFYLWFVGAALLGGVRRARAPGDDPVRPFARATVAAFAGLFVAGMFEYNFGDVEILVPTLVLSVFPWGGTGTAARG
ncbi:MAG TPA: O-antigen ligase family protein, partial [Thermoanaerobaculia bacterium]|nr:O-antigen ligase family protein [Thermoanaerobaculia bacterium]